MEATLQANMHGNQKCHCHSNKVESSLFMAGSVVVSSPDPQLGRRYTEGLGILGTRLEVCCGKVNIVIAVQL